MLEIFVDEISERASYTFDFLLKENGISYQFNNDFKSFESSTNKKLNYSERHFENVVQLIPSSVLFEETISRYTISKGTFEQEDCLVINGTCDPFAAVFYILSRMEEYGDFLHDEHNRFPANQSVLHQFGWLQRMVCERWSKAIIEFLNKAELIDNHYEKRAIKLVPTFDIDNVYAYKLKDGTRQLLSTMRDYTQQNKKRLSERKLVMKGELQDPFDSYSTIKEIAQNFEVQIFWLLGDYSKFDKNVSHVNRQHQELIQEMSKSCRIGIHPSYKSNSKTGQMRIEIDRLNAILHPQKVTQSRQHFLKFRLPTTYRELIHEKIEHDYTMGYASEVGFRAGTSRPFKWFDLQKNTTTELTIHPFAYMDGTLLEYKKLSIEESKILIESLFEEFANFGGEFIFLWHNETISNYGKWEGWNEVLQHTLGLTHC